MCENPVAQSPVHCHCHAATARVEEEEFERTAAARRFSVRVMPAIALIGVERRTQNSVKINLQLKWYKSENIEHNIL